MVQREVHEWAESRGYVSARNRSLLNELHRMLHCHTRLSLPERLSPLTMAHPCHSWWPSPIHSERYYPHSVDRSTGTSLSSLVVFLMLGPLLKEPAATFEIASTLRRLRHFLHREQAKPRPPL